MPETTNKGALMGTACHTVFELLLKERHADKFKLILDGRDDSSPAVNRFVKRYVKKNSLPEDANLVYD
jgi:hypothetical protein